MSAYGGLQSDGKINQSGSSSFRPSLGGYNPVLEITGAAGGMPTTLCWGINPQPTICGRSRRLLPYNSIALGTTIDSLITGAQVEIIDNPEHREIIVAMPPEAKLFFRSTKRIPKENIKIILDLIKLSVKEIDAPAQKRKKRL